VDLAMMAVVTTAIVVGMLWPLLSETVHGRHRSEREVHDFVSRVQRGQATADVERTFRDGRYEKLTVRSRSDREWWITTPAQLGASDWIVRLHVEAGRVVSVRVGTADESDVTPARAPTPRPQ
jgi:hypothetical protein